MNEITLKESFGTLSETINGLVKLGYTHDFNIKNECVICPHTNKVLSPDDFQIDKTYRFEGTSDPEYQSILYAISSLKHDLKGVLVNGFGISAEEAATKLVEKLEISNLNSTPNNELSDELINVNALFVNSLDKSIKKLKTDPAWSVSERNTLTIFKSESMSIVLIGLHDKAELKPHKSNGTLSILILEGKIIFIEEQKSVVLEKGQIITLKENISHSVKALSESFLLLTFVNTNKYH